MDRIGLERHDLSDNLVLRDVVRIDVAKRDPRSASSRSPRVLLNDTAHRLDGRPLTDFAQSRTYDTYEGQHHTSGPDWYAIHFPQSLTFNCVEMTMGFPFRDGGWWTSLDLEVQSEPGATWRSVENLAITPPYRFEDSRKGRRPFETYALTFDEVKACSFRVIGRGGSPCRHTSLARLACYRRDLSRWNPASLPRPPVPQIFQLIPPGLIWDLSTSLMRLTGLVVGFPKLEYYLDDDRYEKFWERVSRNYHGQPELWFLLGYSLGWDAWEQAEAVAAAEARAHSRGPHVQTMFSDTLAKAVAPLELEGRALGDIYTDPVVVRHPSHLEWYRRLALKYDIPWPEFSSALGHSTYMSLERLEAAATLLGLIADAVVRMTHRNLRLERRLEISANRARPQSRQRAEIVRQAIEFMQEALEEGIGVADIARTVSLSPSHFCTVFTAQTGRNPSDYLADLRIERAKEYLALDKVSVMDVSVALGYSPSYFSRLFKRKVGCTPGQYCRRARANV